MRAFEAFEPETYFTTQIHTTKTMHRLSIFLFALVAVFTGAIAMAALTSPINNSYSTTMLFRVREFANDFADGINHYTRILLHIRNDLARDIGTLTSTISAFAISYKDLCSQYIHNSTFIHPSTNNSRLLQPLFEIIPREQDAYTAEFVFVLLATNACSVVISVFVFSALQLVFTRRISTTIKQFSKTINENRDNILAVSKKLQSVLSKLLFEILIPAITWVTWALVNLLCYILQQTRSAMLRMFDLTIFTRLCPRCSEAPGPKAPSPRSFADPAAVDKNTKINRLELQLQEWKQLLDHGNRERAREEHQLEEHIGVLERANTAQAAQLREMRRYCQSVGLTSDARAVIRDLRQQHREAVEQGGRREEELLGEVRDLQEHIRRQTEEENARWEKDSMYRAYLQEVNKWKYIARESIAVMKASQKKAEELELRMKENGPRRGDEGLDRGREEHGDGEVARDPLPENQGKPFGTRLTYADGTPVEMPGSVSESEAQSEADDDWVTVSGSGSDVESDEGENSTPAPFGLPASRVGWAKSTATDITAAAPDPKGPGLSDSFHNPFLNLKEATPKSGHSGLAKYPQARRSGPGGISSRR
ncbi:hypothetical protein VM1G_04995 [Cytospora mali]|uniref:Uncharacterized protein n=1 Tax=Cytospora mali TaxID=578113 RepID=A0A194VYL9_CYTMA|nr:hypothetical protein VM1G_04995 [Valsa mali]